MIRNLERNIYYERCLFHITHYVQELLPIYYMASIVCTKRRRIWNTIAAKWLYSLPGKVYDKPLLLLESLTG